MRATNLRVIPRFTKCKAMPKHVVLFLDFDGVTHPEPCESSEAFCRIPLIESVLRHCIDVQIVISSSWRNFHTLEGLRVHFASDIAQRVVGVTPSITDPRWSPGVPEFDRQFEIEHWIENHRPGAHWVAIDDRAHWFEPGCPHLLLTDSCEGFTQESAKTLQKLFVFAVKEAS